MISLGQIIETLDIFNMTVRLFLKSGSVYALAEYYSER